MSIGGKQDSSVGTGFPHIGVLGIVLAYAGFAALWILLSDQAVAWLFREPEAITRASMIKGWLFVAVTALLLYGLVSRLVGRLQKTHLHALQIEQERQQAHALMSAVADASDDAIFAKDGAGRYLLFNAAASRFVGKPAGEVIGRDDRALFPLEQAEMLMAIGRRVMATGRTETNEEVIDTRDGRRVFLGTKGPLRDAEGGIIGIFGISRDITDRKRREEGLRHERDLARRYLDTAQTLMVALDRNGCITMINRKGCELLGRSEADLLGKSWFDTCLPQPEGREQVYPVFQAILAGGLAGHVHTEHHVLCRDGRRCLVSWHNNHLTDEDGNIVGTLSSGEDITARKAVEVELTARNDELERFNRASIGREMRVLELKQQVNALAQELGRPPPYPQTASLDDDAPAAAGEHRS